MAFRALVDILGYDFDLGKDRDPTSTPDYLGATLTFSGNHVAVLPKAGRLDNMRKDLWRLIREGCGRAQNLASIRGRLLHVLDCARGRLGGNIMPRLAKAVAEGQHELSTEARAELKAFASLLERARWREAPLLNETRTITVISDAMWAPFSRARLCYIVVTDDDTAFGH